MSYITDATSPISSNVDSSCQHVTLTQQDLVLQGTVKPAHYHVLHDENAFGSDAIQIATYWLCYAFCRCTRSVSYCPPAYYAHLVADRGRVLLDREGLSEDYDPRASAPSTTSAGSGSKGQVRFFPPHDAIKNKMFFC